MINLGTGQVPMLRYREDDAEVKYSERSVYVFEEGCRCNQIGVAISQHTTFTTGCVGVLTLQKNYTSYLLDMACWFIAII